MTTFVQPAGTTTTARPAVPAPHSARATTPRRRLIDWIVAELNRAA